MAMLKLKALSIGLLISTVSLSNAETRYDIGRMATDAEIAAWNLDIDRNGKSLPAGSGTVQHGREIYKAQCAACHGDNGAGNPDLRAPRIAGTDDWYLAAELRKFRSGVRGANPKDMEGRLMRPMARGLKDEDAIRNVISYIDTLKP